MSQYSLRWSAYLDQAEDGQRATSFSETPQLGQTALGRFGQGLEIISDLLDPAEKDECGEDGLDLVSRDSGEALGESHRRSRRSDFV